jgi:predicted GIY-YIG superfamily endonuclease
MYYVYIIKSQQDESIYKGMTEDIDQRLAEHNAGSARYSSAKRPYDLVWYSAFHSKSKALQFERYLKHGSGHAFTKRHLL